ncbi:putative effector protein [Ceratobasidium theobromae]|uniref:Putative effector protein n=1 Tax=Ceratobasidium theobromae TaxID=1582974 RepID=A0A5N5QG18_9AGAM|nr:putative effector protein [Ceratobasidium theobromae]
MQFFITRAAFIAAAASLVAANPVAEVEGQTLAKRETSYGNPDLVTDQGNRFKLNFGSTSGHPNACPGHYICSDLMIIDPDIPRNGNAHGDVSLGNPDDFVDEGNRWRLNYGSTSGHPNACDGHYICYINK